MNMLVVHKKLLLLLFLCSAAQPCYGSTSSKLLFLPKLTALNTIGVAISLSSHLLMVHVVTIILNKKKPTNRFDSDPMTDYLHNFMKVFSVILAIEAGEKILVTLTHKTHYAIAANLHYPLSLTGFAFLPQIEERIREAWAHMQDVEAQLM